MISLQSGFLMVKRGHMYKNLQKQSSTVLQRGQVDFGFVLFWKIINDKVGFHLLFHNKLLFQKGLSKPSQSNHKKDSNLFTFKRS